MANIASTNPYVFMEVGPNAVTINSISAHVVATTAAPDTQTTPTTQPGGYRMFSHDE